MSFSGHSFCLAPMVSPGSPARSAPGASSWCPSATTWAPAKMARSPAVRLSNSSGSARLARITQRFWSRNNCTRAASSSTPSSNRSRWSTSRMPTGTSHTRCASSRRAPTGSGKLCGDTPTHSASGNRCRTLQSIAWSRWDLPLPSPPRRRMGCGAITRSSATAWQRWKASRFASLTTKALKSYCSTVATSQGPRAWTACAAMAFHYYTSDPQSNTGVPFRSSSRWRDGNGYVLCSPGVRPMPVGARVSDTSG